MQQIILTGNVVGEVRENVVGQNNTPVINFTVKVSEYAGKGDDGKSTFNNRFYDCSLWNRDGLHPYIKRGKLVTLTGRAEQPTTYTNNDGDVVASNLKVTVNEITVGFDISTGQHSSHQLVDGFDTEYEDAQPSRQPKNDIPF